ncbi:TPA: nucleotidyltransferase, partial [Candidatus Sumerlaeota bacterium]|nr:nucleotidyltransferase [Candidatus Sumerlaeota bacterium]
MSSPTLVVMAAGIGSRFGGLKQIEPVGPSGETIIDYSIYDAIRAGFKKVVFIIRKDIEEAFKEAIGRRFENKIDVRYVFQELDKLPAGFTVPEGRKKPWGTGQAVLMAAEEVNEPFAVINGDDFYGSKSMQLLAEYLGSVSASSGKLRECAMVGFLLRQTLSEFGHVARGVCSADANGFLANIVERTKIMKEGNGARFTDEHGAEKMLTRDEG